MCHRSAIMSSGMLCGVRATYLAALAGWVTGGLAAPVVCTVALLVAVDAMCKGAGECSWGFELIRRHR